MRRALKNLLFSVLTAAVILGGSELALRLVGWPDAGIYAGDPGSVWWLRANLDRELDFSEEGTRFHVRTGSLGFRGADPDPGGIACVGDSTTFGWGVEEDETWSARLATHLGRATLNAGVPGYSTHQALATVDRLLATRPSTVILALVVRDAQLGPQPDHEARPSPAPSLRLMAAVRELLPREAAPAPGTMHRVPPERFESNLRALTAALEAEGVEVRLLAFPMVEPSNEHLEVLRRLGAQEVTLPRELFFEKDPIHLTSQGHDRLAQEIATAW